MKPEKLLLRQLIKQYPDALSSFDYKKDYAFFIAKKHHYVVTQDIYTLKHKETGLYLNPINKKLYTKVPYEPAKGKAIGKAKGKAIGKAKGKAVGKLRGKLLGKNIGKHLNNTSSQFQAGTLPDTTDYKQLFKSILNISDEHNFNLIDSWDVFIPDHKVQLAIYDAVGSKLGDNAKTDLQILKCFIVWFMMNVNKIGNKDEEVQFTDSSCSKVGDLTSIISHQLYSKLIENFLKQGIIDILKKSQTDYNTWYTTYKILYPLDKQAPKITITIDSHPQIIKTLWLFLKKKNLGIYWNQVNQYKDAIQFDIEAMKKDEVNLVKIFAEKYYTKKRSSTLETYVKNNLSWVRFFEFYQSLSPQMKIIYFKIDTFGKRLHSPCTYTPKEYRKYIKHTGDLYEIDLRASQPTLLCQILANNGIKDEKFIKDVEEDHYYKNIMNQYDISRGDAKQKAMQELYCKVLISGHRINPTLDNFKKRYPIAGNFCQQIKSEKRIPLEYGHKKKIKRNANLAMDLQRFESKIFSEIRAELVLNSIKHVPIHDAIIILDQSKKIQAENIVRERLDYHLKDVKYHLHVKKI